MHHFSPTELVQNPAQLDAADETLSRVERHPETLPSFECSQVERIYLPHLVYDSASPMLGWEYLQHRQHLLDNDTHKLGVAGNETTSNGCLMGTGAILGGFNFFMPASSLAICVNALQALMEVPSGQYLLAHGPQSPYAFVLRGQLQQEEQGSLHDLHAQHETCGALDDKVPSLSLPRWKPERSVVRVLDRVEYWYILQLTPCSCVVHCSAQLPQIPFTHPPADEPAKDEPKKTVSTKGFKRPALDVEGTAAGRANGHSGSFPRYPNVRYCYSFAEGRGCAKGDNCNYPHISYAEVRGGTW